MSTDTPPPPEPDPAPACTVCLRQSPPSWRLREDDRYCTLCGGRVLHLRAGDRVPDDRELYLYQVPGQPVRLMLQSAIGPGPDAAQREVLPRLVPDRSWAQFSGPEVPELHYRVVAELTRPEWPTHAVVRLEPVAPDLARVRLPAKGVRGRLRVATEAGDEDREARLMPRPARFFTVAGRAAHHEVVDPDSGEVVPETWQVHERKRGVLLRLELRAAAPVWVLRARPDEAGAGAGSRVLLRGFEAPFRAVPDHPRAFELEVDSTDWSPGETHRFAFRLKLANASYEVIAGGVILSTGRPLLIVGANPLVLTQLQLGRVRTEKFTLTAGDAPAGDAPGRGAGRGIKLVDFRVEREPDAGEWLKISEPSRDRLPMEIQPAAERRAPDEMELLIDTSRLDRSEFGGKLLRGRAVLVDGTRREWDVQVNVTVQRPLPLGSAVAVDWGTTNTCAAYRAGAGAAAPKEVLFSEERNEPEKYPSDVYFVDASDRENPTFLIGPEAVRRAEAHPECCLRSLKRKFQAGAEVQVIDEQGRIHSYPVERLVQHVLHRMICMAESYLGKEIHRIGFTFPTKWTIATRDRLAGVVRRLEAQLAQERRPAVITIDPPEIDEANAVSISLLSSTEGPDMGDKPEYHVIAYDFGGGTVDTSILKVSSTEEVQATRYVGLGGQSNFGGDEVTRAVMMLLRKELYEALRGYALKLRPERAGTRAWVSEVPLAADVGDDRPETVEQYLIGRRNWTVLWEIAERIKFTLCASAPADDGTSPTVPIKAQLAPHLSRIGCRVSTQESVYDEDLGQQVDGPVEVRTMALDRVFDSLGGPAGGDAVYQKAVFTLEDVYDFELDDIESTNDGKQFTVGQRVRETVQELAWQCDDAIPRIRPDVIVLAGGGCRLPLILALMDEYFAPAGGHAPVFHSREFSKRRVAHGMANYLAYKDMTGVRIEPARSVEVTHHHLGLSTLRLVRARAVEAFTTVVRAGSKLDDPAAWYPFEFRPQPGGPGGGARLVWFLKSWRVGTKPLGEVDFMNPVAGPGSARAEPLPYVERTTYGGELRLLGDRGLEVRVTLDGEVYGPYPFVEPPGELLARLQQ